MCYARRQRSSWARIKLSKNLYHIRLASVTIFFRAIYLSFFYFVWVYITLLWRDLVFRTSQCFVLRLLLFNFQWPFALRLADSLTIIPHLFPLVNTFSKNSFKNFFRGFVEDYGWWAIRDSNPGPTGYEPVALTNWANGPIITQIIL